MNEEKKEEVKAEKDERPIVRKEFTQMCKIELTQKEILAAGESMADAQKERTQAETELTSVKAQFKSLIEAADCKVKHNANLIRDKFEMRLTACERIFDYALCLVTEVRVDTGEQVHQRPMSNEEKQMELIKP